jgi:hypothetical protein
MPKLWKKIESYILCNVFWKVHLIYDEYEPNKQTGLAVTCVTCIQEWPGSNLSQDIR